MSIETYRYLFSALIQVFGALIAIGGIFMIWRYDLIQRNIESVINRLARYVAFAENKIEKAHESKAYDFMQSTVDDFLTYEPLSIIIRTNKVVLPLKEHNDRLNNHLANKPMPDSKLNYEKGIRDNNNSISRLNRTFKKYMAFLILQKRFRLSIWQIMGPPAILTLLFSLTLILGEQFFSYQIRLVISYLSLFIASFALLYLINNSSKSFKLNVKKSTREVMAEYKKLVGKKDKIHSIDNFVFE